MNTNEELLFRFYFEKAENVLRDRNNFLALFFAAFISISIPLTLNEINPVTYSANITGNSSIAAYNFIGQIGSVRSASNFWNSLSVIFSGVMAFIVLYYLVFELKYREYREKYRKILIKENVNDILKSLTKVITYKELCGMIVIRTGFPANHIMPILKELSELHKKSSEEKTGNMLTTIKAFLSKVFNLKNR